MEGTDITEPIVMLSQNQVTCICLHRCATLSQKYGDLSSLHFTESWALELVTLRDYVERKMRAGFQPAPLT